MKNNDLVNKIFEYIKDISYTDIDKLFDTLRQKKDRYESEKSLSKEFIKAAENIFKLDPLCKLIPIAIDYTNYSKIITETGFDQVCEIATKYMEDDYDIIKQRDDLTIGAWKNICKNWNICIKKSGMQHKVDKDGDYCEFTHYGVYCYNKETKKIEYFDDVNRK